MGKINYSTITLTLLMLKVGEILPLEWYFVFMPIFVWLVMATIKFFLKAFVMGLIIGVVNFFKNESK